MTCIVWKSSKTGCTCQTTLVTKVHSMTIMRWLCSLNSSILYNISINDISLAQNLKDPIQNVISSKCVTSIEKDAPLSCSHCNSFVHCIIDTLILFRYPMTDMSFILTNYLYRTIGRTAINNNVFNVLILLCQNATDSLLYQ